MKKAAICLAVIFSLAFFSCNKEETTTSAISDTDLLMASAVADYSTEADFQSGMETANDNNSMRVNGQTATSSLTPCATVTVSGTSFPRTFTINFGSGCTSNGITRSGILIITLSGYLMENGTTMTVERNNYFVNGYKIEGTVVYNNITTDPAVPMWTRSITNGVVTNPAGAVFTHSGTRQVKQIAGVSTPFILADNIFEITSGNHTVTGPNGNTLTATIVTPLIKKHSCAYISQGVLNLQGVYLDGDLDYGDNQCDNMAVYTHSNGMTYMVHL